MSSNTILRDLPAGQIACWPEPASAKACRPVTLRPGGRFGVARRPDGDLIVNATGATASGASTATASCTCLAGTASPAPRATAARSRKRASGSRTTCTRTGTATCIFRTWATTRSAASTTAPASSPWWPATAGSAAAATAARRSSPSSTARAGLQSTPTTTSTCQTSGPATIRRIDAQTGIIDLFAGYAARHYPSERGASRPFAGAGLSLMGYHGDGGPASHAAFYHPEHLAFDSRGDLYVCDNSNDRIRRIDMRTRIISTVLGNGQRASNGDGARRSRPAR